MAKEPTKTSTSSPKLTQENTPRHKLLAMGQNPRVTTTVDRPATKS